MRCCGGLRALWATGEFICTIRDFDREKEKTNKMRDCEVQTGQNDIYLHIRVAEYSIKQTILMNPMREHIFCN